MTGGEFNPLLALSSLANITLHGWDPISVTNSTLDTMARSWPDLETLSLHVELGSHPCVNKNTELQATLAGIVPFARHCPKLRSLCVPVDPNVRVDTIATTTRTVCNVSPFLDLGCGARSSDAVPPPRENSGSAVTHLYPGCTEPDVPTHTVALISTVFPRVREFPWDAEENGSLSRPWTSVNYFLCVFACARSGENSGEGRVDNETLEMDTGFVREVDEYTGGLHDVVVVR